MSLLPLPGIRRTDEIPDMPKTASFSPCYHHQETGISIGHHSLKVVTTTLSQAVQSRYKRPYSQIWSPKFSILLLSRFIDAPVNINHTSRSALSFILHSPPLSPVMCFNTRSYADEYLAGPVFLFLSGLCTPSFTVRFYELCVFSSFSTSSAGKRDIIRSIIVWNGSIKNDAGRSDIFSTSVDISKASSNPSSATYPQWNRTALFPVK